MEHQFSDLSRYISIFDRLMKMYYDRGLSDYQIGWGQQFYVEYLHEHPGATPQEMTRHFQVDKATLTKIIRKLSQIEYIRIEIDSQDHRIKHLYLTSKALPAVQRIQEIHKHFQATYSQGFSESEIKSMVEDLRHMVQNLSAVISHRMEEGHNG